ncbi:DUF177 domain-containing protein [Bacteroidales bacterium OttesenSCG-928-B11]|nr:DUF177 domain-containing protein [Bacteroidales bacterium OttesenSCG-928-E04]MDL2309179.1 DUF177 domain-containing protein [Bacteroidales bacterium OttesenSCG-928-C03]MDL2312055.1 DUF177 domain-containing protein [Bacteroidales bacterium OttesenSCG-928-B11]
MAEIATLEEGLLKLEIEMIRNETMIDLFFHFSGNVTTSCHRCLDPYTFDLEIEEQLMVKLVPFVEDAFDNDEMWVVNENEYELDVFHFVYETIMLSLPMQITHPDNPDGTSSCNPDALERLEKLSQKEETEHDPRWDALRDIKQD